MRKISRGAARRIPDRFGAQAGYQFIIRGLGGAKSNRSFGQTPATEKELKWAKNIPKN